MGEWGKKVIKQTIGISGKLTSKIHFSLSIDKGFKTLGFGLLLFSMDLLIRTDPKVVRYIFPILRCLTGLEFGNRLMWRERGNILA